MFLTDTAGRLQQVVNLRSRPGQTWTPDELTNAVPAALTAEPPALQTDRTKPEPLPGHGPAEGFHT